MILPADPFTLSVAAGAVVVVLALVALAWRLFGRRAPKIETPEEAAEAADQALAGFATQGAVVGADGAGALAVDRDGRVAVMKRAGARIAVREVAWSALRSTGSGIVIETSERGFGSVALSGVNVLDIRRLAPAETSRFAQHLGRA